jgi:hypothetical protein
LQEQREVLLGTDQVQKPYRTVELHQEIDIA